MLKANTIDTGTTRVKCFLENSEQPLAFGYFRKKAPSTSFRCLYLLTSFFGDLPFHVQIETCS